MKLGLAGVELEAELVKGFAEVYEDELQFVVGGGDNGDVVCVDDDSGVWASVRVFDLGDY